MISSLSYVTDLGIYSMSLGGEGAAQHSAAQHSTMMLTE